MKTIFYYKLFIIFLLLLKTNIVFSDEISSCLKNGELIIWNNYADNVFVKVIPVGSIFSGWDNTNQQDHKYSFRPSLPNNGTSYWTYVVGGTGPYMPYASYTYGDYDCSKGGYTIYDWDDGTIYAWSYPQFVAGAISYGLWRVEFYYEPQEDSPPSLISYCYIDYRDWRAPNNCTGLRTDLELVLESDNLYFRWGNWLDENSIPSDMVPINASCVPNRTIEWWRQVIYSNCNTIEVCSGSPDKGNFMTRSEDVLDWPLKATDFTGNNGHIDFNILDMNLYIQSTHYATIKQNSNFTVDNSVLMQIESNAKLTLKQNSSLTLKPNSLVYVRRHGYLCLEGGTIIYGGGKLIFEFF
jgi:hypothetical protein